MWFEEGYGKVPSYCNFASELEAGFGYVDTWELSGTCGGDKAEPKRRDKVNADRRQDVWLRVKGFIGYSARG